MKKFSILVSTLLLVLGFATSSLGSTVSIDLKDMLEFSSTSGFDGYGRLGADIPLNQFKIAGYCAKDREKGVDYLRDASTTEETTTWMAKGGYNLINSSRTRLDICVGYYERETERKMEIWNEAETTTTTITYSSLLLGIDSRFTFNRKIWLDVQPAFGLSPTREVKSPGYGFEDDLSSLLMVDLKCHFLFSRNFGAALGLFYEEFKGDGFSFSRSINTLGFFYKF